MEKENIEERKEDKPEENPNLYIRNPYSGAEIRFKPNVVFDIGGDPCGPKGKSIEEIRIYPGDEEKAIIYILRAANLLRGYPRQEANVKALRECFANIIAEAR